MAPVASRDVCVYVLCLSHSHRGVAGRVVAFTSEPLHQQEEDDSQGRSKRAARNESRVSRLRNELAALQAKVQRARHRFPSAGLAS